VNQAHAGHEARCTCCGDALSSPFEIGIAISIEIGAIGEGDNDPDPDPDSDPDFDFDFDRCDSSVRRVASLAGN